MFARLAPGVSMAQAQSEMSAIAKRLETELEENRETSVRLASLTDPPATDAPPTSALPRGPLTAAVAPLPLPTPPLVPGLHYYTLVIDGAWSSVGSGDGVPIQGRRSARATRSTPACRP